MYVLLTAAVKRRWPASSEIEVVQSLKIPGGVSVVYSAPIHQDNNNRAM